VQSQGTLRRKISFQVEMFGLNFFFGAGLRITEFSIEIAILVTILVKFRKLFISNSSTILSCMHFDRRLMQRTLPWTRLEACHSTISSRFYLFPANKPTFARHLSTSRHLQMDITPPASWLLLFFPYVCAHVLTQMCVSLCPSMHWSRIPFRIHDDVTDLRQRK
jgi:hypothetical protein